MNHLSILPKNKLYTAFWRVDTNIKKTISSNLGNNVNMHLIILFLNAFIHMHEIQASL